MPRKQNSASVTTAASILPVTPAPPPPPPTLPLGHLFLMICASCTIVDQLYIPNPSSRLQACQKKPGYVKISSASGHIRAQVRQSVAGGTHKRHRALCVVGPTRPHQRRTLFRTFRTSSCMALGSMASSWFLGETPPGPRGRCTTSPTSACQREQPTADGVDTRQMLSVSHATAWDKSVLPTT